MEPAPLFLGLPRRCWLAAALYVLLLAPKIGAGTLWHHDELLTANRTRELLLRSDPFALTVNFSPSVQKPPLQYWVGALLLRAWPAWPEFALRLPSLLSGAGCLLAAAWLARVYFPGEPAALAGWSAVAAGGCGYLIHFSRVALLDTGAALFLTLALVGCRLARRDARWNWFVAAQCILGAWQKAPYALLAWIVVLAVERLSGEPPGPARQGFHLAAAFLVALGGSLGWWIVQWLHTGPALLRTAGQGQLGTLLRAHDASDRGRLPWVYGWWLVRDWALAGVCAAAAAGWAAWRARREPAAGALGWVCLVFGGVTACLAYRVERYLVAYTPALAVLCVYGVQRLAASRGPLTRRWLLPAVLATTLPGAAFQFFKPALAQPELLGAAQALARAHAARPGERVFVCTDSVKGFEAPTFVLFYAGLREPMEIVPFRTVQALGAAVGPARGICNRAQWAALRATHPGFRADFAAGNWVMWGN